MSQQLEFETDKFLASVPDLSGITWPDPSTVAKARFKQMNPGVSEETFADISASSPMVIAVDLELQSAKANLNSIIGVLPMLAVPVSIPLAMNTVKALLPATIVMLKNLGISLPEVMLPVLLALNAAQGILDAAASVLDPPPLNVLKSLLGIGN